MNLLKTLVILSLGGAIAGCKQTPSATALAEIITIQKQKRAGQEPVAIRDFVDLKDSLLQFSREHGSEKTSFLKKSDFKRGSLPLEVLEAAPDFVTYNINSAVLTYIGLPALVLIVYAVSDEEAREQIDENGVGSTIVERISNGVWVIVTDH